MTGIELMQLVADHLRSGVSDVPVFVKGAKDPHHTGDYIGVNVLAKGHGLMDVATVNVNIHVKDLAGSLVDYDRMQEIGGRVLPLIDDVMVDGVNLYLVDDSIGEDDAGGHYLNYKLEVVHLN